MIENYLSTAACPRSLSRVLRSANSGSMSEGAASEAGMAVMLNLLQAHALFDRFQHCEAEGAASEAGMAVMLNLLQTHALFDRFQHCEAEGGS